MAHKETWREYFYGLTHPDFARFSVCRTLNRAETWRDYFNGLRSAR